MIQKYFLKNKKNTTFKKFDIIDFHPSKTKELLLHSINLAKNFTVITQEELHIILTRRKSIHINNNSTSVKTGTDDFDVTMGSFDSPQIADLVGIYILNALGRITNLSNIGIYRDDRLISIPNSNGPQSSKIQKIVFKSV